MDSSCFCISVRKASRRITAIYDDALAPVGINLAQFSLLKSMRRLAPVSLTDLAKNAELDRSTMGRNMRVLERMGLASSVGSQDQREAAFALTPLGQQTLDRAMPLWEQVQVDIEEKLGPANAAQLNLLLSAL